MKEYWIVSINIPYYPYMEIYDEEAKAKKGYEEAVRLYGKLEEYDGPVYLAKVLESATKNGIEKEVEK